MTCRHGISKTVSIVRVPQYEAKNLFILSGQFGFVCDYIHRADINSRANGAILGLGVWHFVGLHGKLQCERGTRGTFPWEIKRSTTQQRLPGEWASFWQITSFTKNPPTLSRKKCQLLRGDSKMTSAKKSHFLPHSLLLADICPRA